MVHDIRSNYSTSIQQNNPMAAWNLLHHNQQHQNLQPRMDENFFGPGPSVNGNLSSGLTKFSAPYTEPEVEMKPIASQFDSTRFSQLFY